MTLLGYEKIRFSATKSGRAKNRPCPQGLKSGRPLPALPNRRSAAYVRPDKNLGSGATMVRLNILDHLYIHYIGLLSSYFKSIRKFNLSRQTFNVVLDEGVWVPLISAAERTNVRAWFLQHVKHYIKNSLLVKVKLLNKTSVKAT